MGELQSCTVTTLKKALIVSLFAMQTCRKRTPVPFLEGRAARSTGQQRVFFSPTEQGLSAAADPGETCGSGVPQRISCAADQKSKDMVHIHCAPLDCDCARCLRVTRSNRADGDWTPSMPIITGSFDKFSLLFNVNNLWAANSHA